MMMKLCLFWISVLNVLMGILKLTVVYRKPTFTGLFTNFVSFLPTAYKKGFVFSLLFRYFNICSSYQIFHVELEKFKKLLLQNGYPKFFIDRCVKTFLDKMISPPSDCFTLYGESCYSDPSTITQIVFLGFSSSTTTCDF
jgi:hypothetical protein